MAPESQAAFEGPFILSEGSARRGREEGGEKVCKEKRRTLAVLALLLLLPVFWVLKDEQ